MLGRARLPFRLALSATTLEEAADKLASFAAGELVPGISTGQTPVAAQPRPVFLFTGQGAQYAGMGQDLYAALPAFRAALDRCAAILAEHLEVPLLDVLFAEPGSPEAALLDQTAYTQPTLFALEYSLAELWLSWGIRPAAVAGHSLGEYVAAVIAGVLSLEDALYLVATRGQLMGSLPEGGTMAAVFAPAGQVREELAPYREQVTIAAINGPDHTVVSGEQAVVEALTRRMEEQGVKVRALTVSHAFHSHLMEPMLDAFQAAAGCVAFRASAVPLISNVTGEFWPAEYAPDTEYWRRQIREAVQWGPLVEWLLAEGYELFLEVGPQPVLSGMGKACTGGDAATWLPSLRRGRDDLAVIHDSLGQLYVAGVEIDWRVVFGDQAKQRVDLPTYPFQRRRYWTTAKAGGSDVARRRLLGKRIDLATDPQHHLWEGAIDTSSFAYLDDHRVQGAAVFPATAYIEMAMSAAIEIVGSQPFSVLNVDYRKPIIFSPGTAFTVQVSLHTVATDEIGFEIHSRPANVLAGGWTRNVQGTLMHGSAVAPAAVVDLAAVRERCTQHMTGETFYGRMAAFGNQWGATFQGVTDLWQGEREALSLVRVPERLIAEIGEYHFHPAVADACGHVLTATLPLELRDEHTGAFVGGSIDEARLYSRPQGTAFWCHARLRPDADERANVLVGDVQVFDKEGRLVSETIGARLWYLDEDERQSVDPADWLYTVDWEPHTSTVEPDESKPAGTWVVLADTGGVGQALAQEIRRQGGRCIVSQAGYEYIRETKDSYTLRADSRTDIERMLLEAVEDGGLRGIAHLWGLDNPRADDLTPPEVLQRQDASLVTAVHVIQSVAAPLSQSQRIWFATRAAQPAGDTRVDPAQSPLWGLGRALALEHTELWGGLIDLDPEEDPAAAGRRLASELLNPEEDQVALRAESRYVVRLSRRRPDVNATPSPIRPDATYLVTGGLGGLGLGLAERLVRRGARHLILVGRTQLPPRETWDDLDPESRTARQVATIRELEALGAQLHTVAVDVADEPAMRQMLDELEAAGTPPIAGVFHAAGTLHHSTLDTLDIDELRRQLWAKLAGGWTLHRIFCTAELEQFVLFSSASAVLSSPRLGAYAAANAFLDGLARHRSSIGLAGLSINWGLWGEIGMASQFDRDDVALLALRGMGVISPDQGFDLLERLMSQGDPQVAVLPVDWSRWRERYPALTRAPLLRNLLDDVADVADGAPPSLTAEMLEKAVTDEQLSMVEAYLSEQAARVLGIPLDEFDRDAPFSTMGIDSLMAVELKNRVESDLGVVLPIVALLQGPTARTLAEEVLDLFGERSNTSPSDAIADAHDEMARFLAQLDELTDEQIDALLADLATERVTADD
jgi:acyl transferase domain-containing protein